MRGYFSKHKFKLAKSEIFYYWIQSEPVEIAPESFAIIFESSQKSEKLPKTGIASTNKTYSREENGEMIIKVILTSTPTGYQNKWLNYLFVHIKRTGQSTFVGRKIKNSHQTNLNSPSWQEIHHNFSEVSSHNFTENTKRKHDLVHTFKIWEHHRMQNCTVEVPVVCYENGRTLGTGRNLSSLQYASVFLLMACRGYTWKS